ncbi:MAG: septal ring lytic transglycosylase RlpA family protein [Enterobacterales bacterium]|nr:septal ring lytic transglycosylase RlpA family protein [Enterobacterales bacterium]
MRIKKTGQVDAGPKGPVDWTQVKPAVPRAVSPSRYGNPKSYEVYGQVYHVLPSANHFKQKGVASWYGSNFHGRRTSSGETYDMLKLTAAHKTLPIPCYVKVTNHDNGREIIVRVNDRGPFIKSRIIDLSYAAAYKLGMAEKGTANVSIESIGFDSQTTLHSNSRPSTKRPISVLGQVKTKPLLMASNKGQSDRKRFVQVGAYSSRQRAETLQKILAREIQLPVKISLIQRSGKKLYRVRIGPVDDLSMANKLVETIKHTELGKPSIVYQE